MKYFTHCLWWFLLFAGVASAQPLSGVKIYINPGHGGFDPANDRNVVIAPFTAGDTEGFWESKSNLVKGLCLRKLLESAGAQVFMSRTENRDVDDLPLSAIAEEANANRVDFMISVHSNAFKGATNYPLMLFHGRDNYPILPQSMELANLFWDYLFSNQVTHWTYTKRNVRGDKSFAPVSWDGYGVLRPLTVPGLISEGSFHDYIPETYRLMNDDYKRLEAWHHYLAFSEFYGGNPGKKGRIAGFVKDSTQQVTAYSFISGSKDQWLPVNGAKVTLIPGDLDYTVDQLNNGFFIFDNLDPGSYSLRINADPYATVTTSEVKVDSAKVTYLEGYLKPMEVSNRETAIPGMENYSLTIYPNPVSTVLNISWKSAPGKAGYSVTDLSGRKIRSGVLPGDTSLFQLPVEDLEQGAYILNIIRNGISRYAIFIKR